MKKAWFYAVIGTGALTFLFWLQRPPSVPVLGAREIWVLQSAADADRRNSAAQLDVVVAYGALAWASGSYVRALNRSAKLGETNPEYAAQPDVKETNRQLMESMNRFLRLRGIKGKPGLLRFLSDGAGRVEDLIHSKGATRQIRLVGALTLARMWLCQGEPAKALESVESLEGAMGLEWLCRGDALADLGKYLDAQKAMIHARSSIEKWPSDIDPALLLIVGLEGKAIGEVQAQLLGGIANELTAIQGLQRMAGVGGPLR